MTPERELYYRELFSLAAYNVAGRGMHQGRDSEYLDIIAPSEAEGAQLRASMGGMWSCALTVMGIMREVEEALDVQIDPLLHTRYVIGQAMSWDVTVGMHHHAWRTPDSGLSPKKGDFVIVGPAGYHILTIASDVAGAAPFDTVEGGQVNEKGGMCIKQLHRSLSRVGGALYCGNSVSPATRVYGWIDAPLLVET